MAISAKLIIDDEEFNVLQTDFGYYYDYRRDTLQPTSNGAFYPIRVRVETGTSLSLTKWAIDGIQNNEPQHAKNGRIRFSRRDLDIETALKAVWFRNGFIADYREYFIADGSTPMYIDLTIIAEYMTISDTDERTRVVSREWTPPFHQERG